MPRQVLPVGIAIGVGLIVLTDLLFPVNPFLHAISGTLIQWAALLAGVAFLLGLWNLLIVHLRRVAARNSNSFTSLIVLLTAIVTCALTLPGGPSGDVSQWVFQYVYRPLESSFLALLVFFIVTAAFRGLRIRNLDTIFMFGAALVVLIGQVPVGAWLSSWIPAAKDWILNVPALAGVRGLLIGVALGSIATALRLLTGIDRPYAD